MWPHLNKLVLGRYRLGPHGLPTVLKLCLTGLQRSLTGHQALHQFTSPRGQVASCGLKCRHKSGASLRTLRHQLLTSARATAFRAASALLLSALADLEAFSDVCWALREVAMSSCTVPKPVSRYQCINCRVFRWQINLCSPTCNAASSLARCFSHATAASTVASASFFTSADFFSAART